MLDSPSALWRPWYRAALRSSVALLPVVESNTPLAIVCAPKERRKTAQFRRDVLEKLAEYQVYIRRLKRCDSEAYKTYRRVGAFILPGDMEAHTDLLEPGIVSRLPSFGAISMNLRDYDRDKNVIHAKFFYFTKYSNPGPDVERVSGEGAIYRCVLYYDDANDEKINRFYGNGGALQFAIHVSPSGDVRVLRTLRSSQQVIRHRRGEGRGRKGANYSVVHHQRWSVPQFDLSEEWMKQAGHAAVAVWTFRLFVNFWVQAATASMVRVTATKGGIVMPFVVPELQIPSFFSDRDKVAGQRIFHVVRPHKRSGSKGVRLHFRGARKFQWNGYDIDITVPGRDHIDISDATFDWSWLADNEPTPEGRMEGAEAADFIADKIGAPKVDDLAA